MSVYSQVVAEVCRRKGVTGKEVKSASRQRRIVDARVVIWCAMRSLRFSLPALEKVAFRNHATISKMTRRASVEQRREGTNVLTALGYKPQPWTLVNETGGRPRKHNRPVVETIVPQAPKPKPKKYKPVRVPDYKNGRIVEKLVEVA